MSSPEVPTADAAPASYAPATSAADTGNERRCENCLRPLLGEHCYACGQPTKGLVRQFGSIVGDFLDSAFDFDSRTVRTLGPLLVRPGYLSNEYFAGRRVRYVSPVRLFVFLCLVSFFVLQFAVDPDVLIDNDDSIAAVETLKAAERMLESNDRALQRLRRDANPAGAAAIATAEARLLKRRLQIEQRVAWLRARDAALAAGTEPPPEPEIEEEQGEANIRFGDSDWDPETNPLVFDSLPQGANDWINRGIGRAKVNVSRVQKQPGLLVETFLQTLPQTFFVLLPLFALLLKVFYLFKRRLYMEHLIVALHSHAFLCLALLLMVGLDQLEGLAGEGLIHGALDWLETGVLIWMPIYLFLMQRRVYRQGWIMTSLKFVLLGGAYFFLLLCGALVNLTLNLVTM